MFKQVLPGNTEKILALLSKNKAIQNAYLAGGTAVALQLGHRISYDLDFFTLLSFKEEALLGEIETIGKFKLEKIAWRTIIGKFKDVKFSIFYYKYPVLFPYQLFGKIKVLDLRDLSGMKIAAIASRGTKRDFVDLYFLAQQVTLNEMFDYYEKKFKNLATTQPHILKSLVYFDDAEKDEMPHMLKPRRWEEVKSFFEQEVKRIAIKRLK